MLQIFLQQCAQLGVDIPAMWARFGDQYLHGMWNTIVLAVLATLIGCIIGFICGILNTIPYSKRDNIVKRIVLTVIRAVIRIYVEVFRGTPMILQAVFIYYGLPYFTGTLVQWPQRVSGRPAGGVPSTPALTWPNPSAAASSPSTPARPRAPRPSA